MTLQEKLTQTLRTKTAIKNAIVAKGVEIPESTPFSNYPAMIDEIGKPPWIAITEDNWFDYINTPNIYSWETNDTMAITAPTGEYPWIVENAKTLDSFKLEVNLPDESMWFNSFNGDRVTGVGKHTLVVNRDPSNTNDWSKISFGWNSENEFPSGNQPKVRIWVRIPPVKDYVTCTLANITERSHPVKILYMGNDLSKGYQKIEKRITGGSQETFLFRNNYPFITISDNVMYYEVAEFKPISNMSSYVKGQLWIPDKDFTLNVVDDLV